MALKNHPRGVLPVIFLIGLFMAFHPLQGAVKPVQGGKTLVLESSFEKKKFGNLQDVKGKQNAFGQRGAVLAHPKSYIVKLESAPLATYQGSISGLQAAAPKAAGAQKLNLGAPVSQDYLNRLKLEQDLFITKAKSEVPNLRVVHRYDVILNGLSVILDESDAPKLLSMPGVKAVYEDKLVKADTNISPAFMGAPHVWRRLGGPEKAGEGVIIGIIDTGVWPEHPSVSDPDPSGKKYPRPPEKWQGTECFFGSNVPGDAPCPCNNKLIGAARFMDTYDLLIGLLPTEFPTARDDDGHGTHTGTTAGGNHHVRATLLAGQQYNISGVAPRAHLAFYKCLGDQGGFNSDLLAGIQQAVADGVDVINYSISGGEQPYSEPAELAFLDAYAAGVFVAASAGNSGPGPDTVAHRGPWVTTIGASLTNRLYLSALTLTADNGDSLQLKGTTITRGISTPTKVVFPPAGKELCPEPFAAGTFNNEICLCKNGGAANRAQKSFNVLQGGASGMILYAQTGLGTDNDFVPTINLDIAASTALLDFMNTHSTVQAVFTDGTATRVKGDVMANFSSRGGPNQFLEISKPDVTAPGVNIIAGNTPMPATPGSGVPGLLFQCIQGTSMSSPHAAGAAALLKDLHPEWTPGQIRSALMTTAKARQVYKQDGTTPADPFDFGSGRIDLAKAADPGITFDIPAQDFIDHEGDLKNVNYPSLYLPVMPGKITVKRTVKSQLKYPSLWRLEVENPEDLAVQVPRLLFLPAGGEKTFEISLDASAMALGEVRHAVLHLQTLGHEARFPLTMVRRQPLVTLAKTCDPCDVKKGEEVGFKVMVQNIDFRKAVVDFKDALPVNLRLVKGSVIGGEESGNGVVFKGALAGAEPPIVKAKVTPGVSPAGYLPLSLFGGTIDIGAADETIANYNVPAFTYAGETFSKIGIVSNGYVVVGGGSADDIQALNSNLPDAAAPNNVLSPFWTDLDPGTAGRVLLNVLTDGTNSWVVIEWEAVANFGDGETNTFQIWIQTGTTEGISFTYGDNLSDGDNSLLTVGAENIYGNSGQAVYYNGTGVLPAPSNTTGYEIQVASEPGAPGETRIITFRAKALRPGDWTNCAHMTGDIFDGVNAACCKGKIFRQVP